MTQNPKGVTMFFPADQWIAASIVGLMFGLASYAGMHWRDRKALAAASEGHAAAELAQRHEAVRAAEAEFQETYAEHVPVAGIADYWDREDLITIFFEERVVEVGVDRPWALRPVPVTPRRTPALTVH